MSHITDVYDEQAFEALRDEVETLKALAYIYPPIPRFNKKGHAWRDLCNSHWDQILILRAMLWQAQQKASGLLGGELFTAADYRRAAEIHEFEKSAQSLNAIAARQDFMKNLNPKTLEKIQQMREHQDNNVFGK